MMGLELTESDCDGDFSGFDVFVTFGDDGAEGVHGDGVDVVPLGEFVASSDEGSGAGVGEEFFLEVCGGDDGDGGGSGEVI